MDRTLNSDKRPIVRQPKLLDVNLTSAVADRQQDVYARVFPYEFPTLDCPDHRTLILR